MLDRQHVVQVLEMLRAAFPRGGIEVTPTTVQVWHLALADLEPAEALFCTTQAIRSAKFPPSPGEVRSYRSAGQQAVGADEAYQRVGEAVRTFGWSGEPEARASLGNDLWAVVEAVAGSWGAWCSTPTAAIPSRRARFVEFWTARAARTRRAQDRAEVSGLLDELGLLPGNAGQLPGNQRQLEGG